ncbi:hypothetical protein X975_14071, partial [Stegodyphus mimosarum]
MSGKTTVLLTMTRIWKSRHIDMRKDNMMNLQGTIKTSEKVI